MPFCNYIVIRGFHGLNPPLGTGDQLCVTCPPSGFCPGTDAADFTIAITDAAGNTSEGMVRNTGGAACGSCQGGITGFTFTTNPIPPAPGPAPTPVTPAPTPVTPAPAPGFWQRIKDFFSNLFS